MLKHFSQELNVIHYCEAYDYFGLFFPSPHSRQVYFLCTNAWNTYFRCYVFESSSDNTITWISVLQYWLSLLEFNLIAFYSHQLYMKSI